MNAGSDGRGNVTPIRPGPPEPPAPPTIDPQLAQQISQAREGVLQAMCLVSVVAATLSYDVRVGQPERRQVLDRAYNDLDQVAAKLEEAVPDPPSTPAVGDA
ncbi:MAG: hypothetical protein ACT4UQ_06905 [Gammaproteobacteria bacterium]